MTKAVSPANTARLNSLATAMIHQAEGDHSIAEVSARALAAFRSQQEVSELIDLGPEAWAEQGWTKAELNIAFHSLAGKNNQPAALAMAHERHIVRARAHQATGAETPEAPGYVIPVQQKRLKSETRLIEAEKDDD